MSFGFQMTNLQMRFQKVQFYLYFWSHGTPVYPALFSTQSSRKWTTPSGSPQPVALPLRNMLRSNICMLCLMPFSLTPSLRSIIEFYCWDLKPNSIRSHFNHLGKVSELLSHLVLTSWCLIVHSPCSIQDGCLETWITGYGSSTQCLNQLWAHLEYATSPCLLSQL